MSPEGLTDAIPTNALPTLQHHRVANRGDQSVCKVEAIAQRHTASKQAHSNLEERTCFDSNSRRQHSITQNLWFYSLKQA